MVKAIFEKLIFPLLSFLILFGRFVNQQRPHLQSSNETLNAINVQMANCSLIANQSMNVNNFDVGSGIVFNYPYAINQPLFVNYHPVATIQTQSPAVYYFLPTEPNVYQNQFLLVDPVTAAAVAANRQVSIGNVQIPSQYSVIQNIGQNQILLMDVNRALYEKYNISFNDAL